MTEIPDTISDTQAHNNLKALMDKVWNDSAPVSTCIFILQYRFHYGQK